MRAPRALANSYSSRISTPDPSPTMKPSRSRSNGRLALAGSSLRVDSARSAPNPPIPIGVIAASEPPAIITSAAPRLMISKASAIACADAEQAVQVAEFGPRAPNRIDTWPAARLMIADGMKNGEILRGPPSSRALCSRSMVVNPPIPEAMNTPTRRDSAGVMVRPESSIANCDAAIAYWMKMSIFLTSFFSMYASGSKRFTSPAMRVANWVVSNLVIGATPLWPALIPVQFASVPIPSDDTSPMPVTTTRRLLVIGLYFLVLACDSMYSTASFTRVIFSASSSGISMPNSSSNAMTSSTVSSESAPRSSTNEASAVTSSSSTPSCSTMMLLTLSATAIQSSYMYIPPLTARTCPVIYDASSDARKQTAAATSSTVPGRPSGICAAQSTCVFSLTVRVMSVSIMPGATTLTVMARDPTSRASAL